MAMVRGGMAACLVLVACEAPSPVWHVYRVGNGETLGHVSVRAGVPAAELQRVNHLKDDVLRDDLGLLVPENGKTQALPHYRPPSAAPQWAACDQVSWVPVTRVPKQGCERQLCADRACVCWRDDDSYLADVTVDGVLVHSAPVMGAFEDDHLTLQVARVDLDGDGTPEAVVSFFESVGNGLAVEWWRHLVLARGAPVVMFATSDYGRAFVQQPKGCAFVATWTDDRRDQLRGWGLYWIAQLHVLEGNTLRARGPEVQRRLTRRFFRQRAETMSQKFRLTLPWFTDQGAFVLAPVEEPSQCRSGTVSQADEDERFELQDAGWIARFDGSEEAGPRFNALLDGRTGAALLPHFHSFASGFWNGARAQVCVGTKAGEPWRTLSLER